MPATPRCPRCGYDQSGETARWTDSCPLRGVCPECGQRFDWSLVLAPARHEIRWLPEHAGTYRGWVARSLLVMPLILARPVRFWRSVGVEARVVPAGLILFLVVAAVPARVLMGIGASVYIVWSYFAPTYYTMSAGEMLRDVATQVARPEFGWWFGDFEPVDRVWIAPVLLAHAAYAVMFVVLPDTRRIAKLRFAHVFRAFAYGAAWLFAVQLLGAAAVTLDSVTSAAGNPWLLEPVTQWVVDAYRSPWLMVMAFAWVAWWWGCAIDCGWRVERGRVVWALLSVVASLVGISLHAAISLVLWVWE